MRDDAGLVIETDGNGFHTSLQLQILLDADWVGFVVLSGDPDIVSVTCPEFNAGDPTATIDGQIKNIGDGDGVFAMTLENCGFELYGPTSLNVGKGETRTFSFNRFNTNPGTITEECLLRARDMGNPSNEDTMSVTCKQEELLQCIDGKYNIQSNSIYRCVNGELELQEKCEFGVKITNDIPSCAKEGEKTGGGSGNGNDFDFITIAIAIVAALITLSIVVKAFKK